MIIFWWFIILKKKKGFPDEMKLIDIHTYTFIEPVIVWRRHAQIQGRGDPRTEMRR